MAAELLSPTVARSRVVDKLRAIGIAQARLGKVQGQLDEELDAVRRCHEQRITSLHGRLARLLADLEAFCRAERDRILPGDRKSLATPLGEVGFRKGEPSIRLREGVAEDAACRLLREARLADLVRTKDALDRSAVRKALEDGRLSRAQLRRCGLELDGGDERFHCRLQEHALDGALALRRAPR